MGWDDPTSRLPDPTPGEFSRWVPYTVVQAFFAPDGPTQIIRAKLYHRLASGTLHAAGERIAWTRNGVGNRKGITSIDPKWWASAGGVGVGTAIEAGDITLSIPDGGGGNVSVHFFNLRFEFEGIYDAIPGLRETPAPSSPAAASALDTLVLPKAEYDRWWPPRVAMNALTPNLSNYSAMQVIVTAARDGLVDAAAKLVVARRGDDDPERFPYHRLPPELWLRSPPRNDSAFWETALGEFTFPDGDGYDEDIRATCHGVRFNPEQIESLRADSEAEHAAVTPASSSQPSGAPATQRRRGPKPKSFWGDAMIVVEASISSGKLLASTQADVERAMADWIAEQGFDAGESTVRNYAKLVWVRVQPGQ
jgi:hypothetical protein